MYGEPCKSCISARDTLDRRRSPNDAHPISDRRLGLVQLPLFVGDLGHEGGGQQPGPGIAACSTAGALQCLCSEPAGDSQTQTPEFHRGFQVQIENCSDRITATPAQTPRGAACGMKLSQLACLPMRPAADYRRQRAACDVREGLLRSSSQNHRPPHVVLKGEEGSPKRCNRTVQSTWIRDNPNAGTLQAAREQFGLTNIEGQQCLPRAREEPPCLPCMRDCHVKMPHPVAEESCKTNWLRGSALLCESGIILGKQR